MIFSRVFIYSCLFLVIFAFIPLVKSREFTCHCCGEKNDHYQKKCPYKGNCPLQGQNLVKSREFTCHCCGEKNDHYQKKCPYKSNCPLQGQNLVKSREFTCHCCGEKNDHYQKKCPYKDDCPLHDRIEVEVEYDEEDKLIISSSDCYFEKTITKYSIEKGEKIKNSCTKCAKEGDHKCHGIANMLGGSGDCDNYMCCAPKMNQAMLRMEKFVKNSDGGIYIVKCDNKKHAKTITQIFRPNEGYPTTTVIFRDLPTVYHDEI